MRTETALVAATHARLDRGELLQSVDDRRNVVLVDVAEAKGGAAA
jgi:hypothetical protein